MRKSTSPMNIKAPLYGSVMEHRRPLSARIPSDDLPLFLREAQDPETQGHNVPVPSHPKHGKTDIRELFASRFWGRRRFSDSVSQLPQHALSSHALRLLNTDTGNDDRFYAPTNQSLHRRESHAPASATSSRGIPAPFPKPSLSRHPPQYQQQEPPVITTSSYAPPAPSPRQSPFLKHPTSLRHSPRFQQHPNDTPQRQTTAKPFLHFPGYHSHRIKPRNPFPVTTRREDLVDALAKIEGKYGPVSLKGVGNLARPVLDRSRRGDLAEFLDFAERRLLLPISESTHGPSLPMFGAGLAQSSFSVVDGSVATCTGIIPSPIGPVPVPVVVMEAASQSSMTAELNQRELVRLESELFDTAKYSNVGGSGTAAAKHLTVLTWWEDGKYGTITLFEVDVDDRLTEVDDERVSGLAARRRHAPPALHTSRGKDRVLGLRPVAAMEDVPRQVLVNLRMDQGLKKAVLHHDKGSTRFRWMAQHTRIGYPSYARVRGLDGLCTVHTATGAEFRNLDWARFPRQPQRSVGRRRGRSSLRVEDARDIVDHHNEGRTEANHTNPDTDGVVATIPQFLALLHASRSVVERASSAPVTEKTIQTEDGERLRMVSLAGTPIGTRHRNRDVRVIVLVPDGAKWTEERIFWSGVNGALAELRQKKYRDVIDLEGKEIGHDRGAYEWAEDVRSLTMRSPISLQMYPRTAKW